MKQKNENFLFFFKLKFKKQKYIINSKKKFNPNIHNFLIKTIFKNSNITKKKTISLIYKSIIKFYFFSLKYLKLMVYNKKLNKISYSANFNKLKNKIIISKFPSLVKNKIKNKILKSLDVKKISCITAFLFNVYLCNSLLYTKKTKLNKILIFSNLFFFVINSIESNINL